jgi:hypothetical protein
MNTKNDIVGYRHWDDAKQVEYVFCAECFEDEAQYVDRDKPISLLDIKGLHFYCDICERTLKEKMVWSL